jgi:hemerythrin
MGIPWTPALAIGVQEIDQQHQELFYRLSSLVEGIAGGDRREVNRLLKFLGDYVHHHFGAEERWMLQSGYPGYADHKAEHERFVQEYQDMQREFTERGPTALMGMRVNNWIANWLRTHIAVRDMDLGRFLSRRVT